MGKVHESCSMMLAVCHQLPCIATVLVDS